MLRHFSAPEARFTQVPNDIIRHPRLGSDAVRLLLWLMSLADPSNVSLSEAARRAGIKNAAFQRAKKQLKAEGYAHEWRRQGPDGRWATTQLVSNVPLTADDATAIRDGHRPPTAVKPAVGEPTPRPVGRPQENTEGEKKTYRPPTPQPPASAPTPPLHLPDELIERAALILASVSHQEPRLCLTGREVKQLAPLAADWLLRGATARELRAQLTTGLPEPVHHPAALVHNRLVRKLPDAPPVSAQIPAPKQPEPRVAQSRECRGDHTQPLLFRPVGDETLCRTCLSQSAEGDGSGAVAVRGAAAARAALRGA